MGTARDLIRGSLRLIGAVESGEALAAQEQTDALSALNSMLDAWSTEDLLVFNRTFETFPLVSGQQTYTMGPGGNFDTTRPVDLEAINFVQQNANPTFEIEVKILNLDQWVAIATKNLTSDISLYVYPDYGNPFVSLNFYPIPNLVRNVNIWSQKPLLQIANPSTVISLPPGYEEAIRYNLAVRLAPEYGKSPDTIVVDIAQSSKGAVKRSNDKPNYLKVDDALLRSPKPFNWMTGE